MSNEKKKTSKIRWVWVGILAGIFVIGLILLLALLILTLIFKGELKCPDSHLLRHVDEYRVVTPDYDGVIAESEEFLFSIPNGELDGTDDYLIDKIGSYTLTIVKEDNAGSLNQSILSNYEDFETQISDLGYLNSFFLNYQGGVSGNDIIVAYELTETNDAVAFIIAGDENALDVLDSIIFSLIPKDSLENNINANVNSDVADDEQESEEQKSEEQKPEDDIAVVHNVGEELTVGQTYKLDLEDYSKDYQKGKTFDYDVSMPYYMYDGWASDYAYVQNGRSVDAYYFYDTINDCDAENVEVVVACNAPSGFLDVSLFKYEEYMNDVQSFVMNEPDRERLVGPQTFEGGSYVYRYTIPKVTKDDIYILEIMYMDTNETQGYSIYVGDHDTVEGWSENYMKDYGDTE